MSRHIDTTSVQTGLYPWNMSKSTTLSMPALPAIKNSIVDL